MATYRVYKQLIPAPLNESDPTWAKRQVWVAKLNSTDTVDEYAVEADADAKVAELTAADPTGRVYEVREIEVTE
tara:strand:+ start:319 stop:540 length:222 start_codon:yes stop_codon:yes gene_type:complete